MLSPTAFRIPQKTILSAQDLANYLSSPAKHELLEFIVALASAVRNVTLRDTVSSSKVSVRKHSNQTIDALVAMLFKLKQNVQKIPAEPSPSRYGNAAFRTWFEQMIQVCARLNNND